MALSRKFLKGMGLTEEQIDSIVDAHVETVEGLKADIAKYKADSEALPNVQKKLDEANQALESGKKDTFKAKYEALKEEFEEYKGEQKKKESRATKETAYRALLKDLGISDKRIDTIVKYSDIDDIELDEKGAIKDAKDRMKALKEEWADFIPSTQTKGANTPNPPSNAGGNAKTKEEIMNIKDTVERQKAILENRSLFGI